MSQFEQYWADFCKELGITSKEGQIALAEALMEKWEKEENLNPPKPEGECYFCHKPTTTDNYCYGCKQYICAECDPPEVSDFCGPHTVERHKTISN